MAIPVVDFSAMSLQNNNQPWSENSNAVKDLADELYNAFSTVGFVYLKNHGIPQEMIDSIFVEMDKFFALSHEAKAKYKREHKFCRDGWNSFEAESLNTERPPCYKETLDLNSIHEADFKWPNEEIPSFQRNTTRTYDTMTKLGFRVLSAVAIGLQLKHDAFAYAFEKVGTSQGEVMIRYNYYPTITDLSNVKKGQLRCGEHTDWGAFTFVIQDDVGGLEVRNADGKFVPAPPMEGTIVVNVGDMMERWTADKLKSTVHRVLIPEEQIKRCQRRSIAFFFNPDADAVITCMDGSNKYPPITSGEWTKMKQDLTHK